MKKSKIILLFLIGILLISSIIMGYSYSLWSVTHTQETSNVVNTGCFELTFTESGSNINLLNTYPISDTKGLLTTPYTFTITNTCTISSSAVISIETLKTTTLDNSYIKTSIKKNSESNSTPVILNTLTKNTLIDTTNGVNNYVIKTDYILPNESNTYQVWMWLDESAGNDTQGKILNANIHVIETASQTYLANHLIDAEGGKDAIEAKSSPTLSKTAVSQEYYDALSDTCTEQYCVSKANSVVENGMWSLADDYGTSYYYRGSVTNNYVKFAGFYWRVIRINGNGTIRMIYDGTSAHENGDESTDRYAVQTRYSGYATPDQSKIGYMTGVYPSTTYAEAVSNTSDSVIKSSNDYWFSNNLSSHSDKISDTLFCNDRTISTDYGTGQGYGTNKTGYHPRDVITSTSKNYLNFYLTCPQKNDAFTVSDTIHGNGKLTYSVGLITMDEVRLGGAIYTTKNNNYYLYSGYDYWTLTPDYSNYDLNISHVLGIDSITANSGAFVFSKAAGGIGDSWATGNLRNTHALRPVINLNADTTYSSGDGTLVTPYIID